MDNNGKVIDSRDLFINLRMDMTTKAVSVQSNCPDQIILLGLIEMAKVALLKQGKDAAADIVVPSMRVKM